MGRKIINPEVEDILLGMGYTEEDFDQIADGYRHLKCSVYTEEESSEVGEEPISKVKARELLGEEMFWSGVGRATYHWNCSRGPIDNGQMITFDCSARFKNL